MKRTLDESIWNLPIQPTPKLLLLALARVADAHNTCSPTVEYLVAQVGVTRMTIFVSIKSLEESGLLRIVRRPGHANVYEIVSAEATGT